MHLPNLWRMKFEYNLLILSCRVEIQNWNRNHLDMRRYFGFWGHTMKMIQVSVLAHASPKKETFLYSGSNFKSTMYNVRGDTDWRNQLWFYCAKVCHTIYNHNTYTINIICTYITHGSAKANQTEPNTIHKLHFCAIAWYYPE